MSEGASNGNATSCTSLCRQETHTSESKIIGSLLHSELLTKICAVLSLAFPMCSAPFHQINVWKLLKKRHRAFYRESISAPRLGCWRPSGTSISRAVMSPIFFHLHPLLLLRLLKSLQRGVFDALIHLLWPKEKKFELQSGASELVPLPLPLPLPQRGHCLSQGDPRLSSHGGRKLTAEARR